jgi:hypothetical protein
MGTKPAGGASATEVPVTRIACPTTGDTCNSITTIGVRNLMWLCVSRGATNSLPANVDPVSLLGASYESEIICEG